MDAINGGSGAKDQSAIPHHIVIQAHTGGEGKREAEADPGEQRHPLAQPDGILQIEIETRRGGIEQQLVGVGHLYAQQQALAAGSHRKVIRYE